MNKTTRNGLLALGLAAFAYWRYKMTPEERQNMKNKISDAGNKLKENIPQRVKNFTEEVRNRVGSGQEEKPIIPQTIA